MTAPIASGWSESPGGACTHWKAPPFHGARRKRPFGCPAANGLSRIQTGPLTRPAGIYIDALLTSYRGDPWKPRRMPESKLCYLFRTPQPTALWHPGARLPACSTGCTISRRSHGDSRPNRTTKLTPGAHSSSSALLTLAKATFASPRELSPHDTITPSRCLRRSALMPR